MIYCVSSSNLGDLELFWGDNHLSLPLATGLCPLRLQTHVAQLASALFYCCSLLRNNNMATNLQRLTSSHDS